MNGALSCTLLRIDVNTRAVISKPAPSTAPSSAATPPASDWAARDTAARNAAARDETASGEAALDRQTATLDQTGRAEAVGAASPGATPAPIAVRAGPAPLSPAAEQFANRLRKNARRWSRYMRRAGIDCYRVYDADLPDYSVAIDVYERWMHVQEYAPPPEIDEARAAARLAEAMRIIPEVLGASPADVFLKVRARQRGAAQYAQRATTGIEHEVHEREQTFLVNFTDYLDTGLFLPGREVRRLLGELANGQRFLNLFGYTGTASVAAGRGGAASTTTVDLNGHYLEWAQRNFAANKLKPERNAVIEADALTWVAQTDERYGLIYFRPADLLELQKDGARDLRRAPRPRRPDPLGRPPPARARRRTGLRLERAALHARRRKPGPRPPPRRPVEGDPAPRLRPQRPLPPRLDDRAARVARRRGGDGTADQRTPSATVGRKRQPAAQCRRAAANSSGSEHSR